MMPMSNSQIAARNRQLAAKCGTKSPTVQHGPRMYSYTYGRLSVVWLTDQRVQAEVRDQSGAVVHRGTRDECLAFAQAI